MSEEFRRQHLQDNCEDYHQREGRLPEAYRHRFSRFRRNNPDFDLNFWLYEIFTCEQAVMLAAWARNRIDPAEAIETFAAMPIAMQRREIGWSDEHSVNTHTVAITLARYDIAMRPDLIEEFHGSLAPIIGCNRYGCGHPPISPVTDRPDGH